MENYEALVHSAFGGEKPDVTDPKVVYAATRQMNLFLLGESEDMKNTYSMIAISPEKWPDTNIDGANAFIEWMTSEKASKLIADYGVAEYGEPLFYLLESAK